MNVLVIGLTGTVGSSLVETIQSDYKIFGLARGGKNRAKNGFLFGVPADNILESDITKEDCGLGGEEIEFLKRKKIIKVIHCGASVKFDERRKREIWLTNYQGTINALKLAKKIHAQEFHFVSTAYAGTRRNPYEASKNSSEKEVKSFGIPYSIYAPSIIVGHSRTGRTRSYNGFYGFLLGMYLLAGKAKQVLGEEKVELPVYVDCSLTSTLNLIQMDWVVSTMRYLLKLPPKGNYYFLAHPRPRTFYDICKLTFKILGVSGERYNNYQDRQPFHKDNNFQCLQDKFNTRSSIFLPYVTEERKFSLSRLQEVMSVDYVDPPEITDEFITLLINGAIKNNFGKNYRKKGGR